VEIGQEQCADILKENFGIYGRLCTRFQNEVCAETYTMFLSLLSDMC
jgi:hypothetical protein